MQRDGADSESGRAAVYVGGPMYPGVNEDGSDGGTVAAEEVLEDLQQSGFDTVILWSLHLAGEAETATSGLKEGDLIYNDKPVVSDGKYVGHRKWPELVKRLTSPGPGQTTTVKRVELSVGSYSTNYESADWVKIKNLIGRRGGDQEDSVLYRNFRVLLDTLGVTILNSDDETCYDVPSTVKFARMANRIGYRNFTVVPYTRRDYWTEVKEQLGSLVDRVYLQCYAGGDHNANKEALNAWSAAMGGMPLDPGLWCRHGDDCGKDCAPDQVREKLRTWADAGAKMSGGFIWYYDDIRNCERKTGFTAKQYAEAVKTSTVRPLLHS